MSSAVKEIVSCTPMHSFMMVRKSRMLRKVRELFIYLFIFGAHIIKPAMISFNMMNYKDKSVARFVPIHFTCKCSTDLTYCLWCTFSNITACSENAEVSHLKPVEM